MGFPVANISRRFEDLEAAVACCESWAGKRDALDYEIDGMVIKIDDLMLQADLGIVGKDPRGAIAFKFPALEVTTILVTHDQIEATTMADRIICMNKGKIIQLGSPEELYKKPVSKFDHFIEVKCMKILPISAHFHCSGGM